MKEYFLHLRPRSFVPSSVMVMTGYFASPLMANTGTGVLIDYLILLTCYSILLFGGTCAFNSAFDEDKDTGPLNYLKNPPPIPKYLGQFGLTLMFLSVASGFAFSVTMGSMMLVALLLSLAYSSKIPLVGERGKEIGILDNVINATGCGILSILIGYTYTGAEIDPRILMIGSGFTLLLFGTYPATQIFQLSPNDTYAKARNYSSLLGPKKALRTSAILFPLGLMLLTAAFLVDYGPGLSTSFFVIFAVFVLLEAGHSWKWARAPYSRSSENYAITRRVMIGARLLWIVGEILS